MTKQKILHIITDLDPGGAENMLYELLSSKEFAPMETTVISLTDCGSVSKKIKALGIPVWGLGLKPSFPNPFLVFRLIRWIKRYGPDIVQNWMYHANFIGGIASFFADKNIPVVWGIHHTVADLRSLRWSTRLVVRMNAWLSERVPKKIVCCAQSALDTHEQLGYSAKKMTVIPNGFDIEKFKKNLIAGEKVRRELHVTDDTLLVGLCARFHPDKDHRFFINVADRLHRDYPEIHFVFCGNGVNDENKILTQWIRDAGINSVSHLLGKREDMPAILSAVDLVASTSRSEAFPLIIGEAMACETPCVVTDIGDSAIIVGNTGKVVPFGNEPLFVESCQEILSISAEERSNLGKLARARIEEHYALSKISAKYLAVYFSLIGDR